jgi:hypothetical protein
MPSTCSASARAARSIAELISPAVVTQPGKSGNDTPNTPFSSWILAMALSTPDAQYR